MVGSQEAFKTYTRPDYDYGNRTPIEFVRLMPKLGGAALDPHASLELLSNPAAEPLFTEKQLRDKVGEVAHNYKIIYDPQSSEADPKHFGVTIANEHLLAEEVPAIVIFSTEASSLYDEDGNVNNHANALEIAYTAFKYSYYPIVYIETPGNGNSVNFTRDEVDMAAQNGKLLEEKHDEETGKITDYEVFETIKAMDRALVEAGINTGFISANAGGAHVATAFEAVRPKGTLDRAFLYNLTNISDQSWIRLSVSKGWEVLTQGKYAKRSHDPLKLTEERKDMAREIMGDASKNIVKRRIQQAGASTHNISKLKGQQKIFRRGNKNGQSGAVQLVAAQLQHPDMKQTVVLPAFAAQYKDPQDFVRFMEIVSKLGGSAIMVEDIESLTIPMGQYGHSHYPTVRQTLESYAFHRQ
jgi:hypothetical protein